MISYAYLLLYDFEKQRKYQRASQDAEKMEEMQNQLVSLASAPTTSYKTSFCACCLADNDAFENVRTAKQGKGLFSISHIKATRILIN